MLRDVANHQQCHLSHARRCAIAIVKRGAVVKSALTSEWLFLEGGRTLRRRSSRLCWNSSKAQQDQPTTLQTWSPRSPRTTAPGVPSVSMPVGSLIVATVFLWVWRPGQPSAPTVPSPVPRLSLRHPLPLSASEGSRHTIDQPPPKETVGTRQWGRPGSCRSRPRYFEHRSRRVWRRRSQTGAYSRIHSHGGNGNTSNPRPAESTEVQTGGRVGGLAMPSPVTAAAAA